MELFELNDPVPTMVGIAPVPIGVDVVEGVGVIQKTFAGWLSWLVVEDTVMVWKVVFSTTFLLFRSVSVDNVDKADLQSE